MFKNSTSAIACLLMFLSAAVVLVASQFQSARTALVPDDFPVFRKTLQVPFNGDAMHGSYGSVFQKGQFTVNLSLEGNSSYVVDVFSSDFMVDTVTVKDADGVTLAVEKNSLFETTSPGINTISVSGHYMFDIPSPWATPAGRIGAGGINAGINDTINMTVTALMQKTSPCAIYASIWPVAALFCLIGILIVFQRPIKALIRLVEAHS